MKKTLKAALSILLVLALLATLPLTAMADEPEAKPTPVDNNTSENNNPTVNSGEIMTQNTGTVTSNAGTITDNGVKPAEGQKADPASGTVEKNQYDGKIENNYGTVVENGGTSGAPQIINNYGTVKTNNSGTKSFDDLNQTVTTTAGVEKNYGLVETNARYSIVETNAQGGVISDNYGYVGTSGYWGDPITMNKGEVTNNRAYGVVINGDTGVVVENHSDGSDSRWNDGIVNNYGGKVQYNSGVVYNDCNGTVVENRADGRVENYSGTVTNNYGYVEGGTVETNNVGGVVCDGVDYSKNENNTWVPDKLVDSTVETNYGTHVTFDNLENYFADKGTVNYGVHAMDGDKMVYLGQYKGAMNDDDSPEEVTIEKLQANCKDYKIFGIEKVEDYSWKDKNFVDHNEAAPQNGEGAVETPGTTTGLTSFKISAPTRLKLLWEKIASVFTPAAPTAPTNEPEAKPVKAAAIPTTVAAEDVKVGTTVRAKGQTFKVIEMDDGSMTIVTMGKLSKKDMEDLTAFLAKYFTPEQIELLLGDPELISGELAEKLFGGNTDHIVFKAAKNLFA